MTTMFHEFYRNAPADRHQPLADIRACRYRHAQTHRWILMHVAPVGAEQKPPLRLTQGCKVARNAISHTVSYTAFARVKLRRQHL